MSLKDHMFHLKIFSKTFHNMNMYPLKVSIFHRYPSALNEEEIPELLHHSYFMKGHHKYLYGGMNGILLTNVAAIINFTAKIITPEISDYGYKQRNNTYVGEFSAKN